MRVLKSADTAQAEVFFFPLFRSYPFYFRPLAGICHFSAGLPTPRPETLFFGPGGTSFFPDKRYFAADARGKSKNSRNTLARQDLLLWHFRSDRSVSVDAVVGKQVAGKSVPDRCPLATMASRLLGDLRRRREFFRLTCLAKTLTCAIVVIARTTRTV